MKNLRSDSIHQAMLGLNNIHSNLHPKDADKFSRRYIAVKEAIDRAQNKQSKILNAVKKLIENCEDEKLKEKVLHYFDDTVIDDFRHYQD